MDAGFICSLETCLTGRLRAALPTLVHSPLSPSASSSSCSSSSSSSWSCSLSRFRGHAISRSMKNVKGAAVAAAFQFDSYRIPFTEGIPTGSKLKLFNLPYECDYDALIQHFATCGAVVESLEITERSDEKENASGFVVLKDFDQACAAVARLDGACFVVMSSADEMKMATTALHGYKIEGRSLKVNAAAKTEAC